MTEQDVYGLECDAVHESTDAQGKDAIMLGLADIKNNQELVDAIDWEMTPEEAVRLYLEWGNNWASGNYVIRSKNDETVYFTVSTWKEPPMIYLIRRNSQDAEEIARIAMPDKIRRQFRRENGDNKGVYAIEGVVKDWLQRELRIV